MSNTTEPVKIYLVDDHTVVRQGTREMLEGHPGLAVVGESDSGENLVGMLKLKQPDLLLLDINLPGKNGLDLLAEIKPQFPSLKIILFTAHTDLQYIRKGVSLQADGYLSKMVNKTQLQEAVFSALKPNAEPIYSADIIEKLKGAPTDPSKQLTPRETEILLQVAQGQTNQTIAKNLVLSVKTVDSHVANLIKKVGVSNRSQLTAYAYEQGLL